MLPFYKGAEGTAIVLLTQMLTLAFITTLIGLDYWVKLEIVVCFQNHQIWVD